MAIYLLPAGPFGLLVCDIFAATVQAEEMIRYSVGVVYAGLGRSVSPVAVRVCAGTALVHLL